MPKIDQTLWDKIKWIAPPILTALLSAGVAWGSWATGEINDLKLVDAHYHGDIEVINTKVDLLMKAFAVEYTGPAFHAHDQSKQ